VGADHFAGVHGGVPLLEGGRKQDGRYFKSQRSKMFWPSATMNADTPNQTRLIQRNAVRPNWFMLTKPAVS
jgi:hypothetical protein